MARDLAEQPERDGPPDGFVAVPGAQLGVDVGQVGLHRGKRDEELVGDFAVGTALGEEPEDLTLTPGEGEVVLDVGFGGAHGTDEGREERRGDDALTFKNPFDRERKLVSLDGPYDESVDVEGEQRCELLTVGTEQQCQHHRGFGHGADPLHEIADGDVGDMAHEHQVDTVLLAELWEITPGRGLGDDIDPDGFEYRSDAEAQQRHVVAHNRPVFGLASHAHVARRHIVAFGPGVARAPRSGAYCGITYMKVNPPDETGDGRIIPGADQGTKVPRPNHSLVPKTTSNLNTMDQDARTTEETLVKDHLPLVHYAVAEIAHRIPSHVSRADLVSAAMLGLAQAARSFDPERGIAFDRFASTRIRGALLDELRGRDWASRSVRSKARGLQATTEDLTTKLGRTPTADEIAQAMNLDPASIHKLVDDVHRATVLNYESLVLEGSAESFLISESESPEEAIIARERRAYLTDAVSVLPERLQRVVVGYFFEERSMQELADELGVSESRISQLRAEALVLLKDGMNSQLEPEQVEPEVRPNGRIARRKAAYYAAIAAASDAKTRLSAQAPTVQDKIAANGDHGSM